MNRKTNHKKTRHSAIFKNERCKFSLKVAIFNSISALIAVGVPTFVDPLINTVRYGTRSYFLGSWVLIVAIAVFFLTFWINSTTHIVSKRVHLTILSALIPVWVTLPNFLPEIPHLWVSLSPLPFAITSGATVWIHHHKIDFSFVVDQSLDPSTRFEILKIEYELWFRMTVGVLAVYCATVITYFTNLDRIIKLITSDPPGQFLLSMVFVIAITLNAVWFIFGPLMELFSKISSVKKQFSKIKRK